jgi:PIN domain-containing protein
MTAPIFVDTNVLIYALDERDAVKQTAAITWRKELWRTGRERVSFQVWQECYAQLLRIWPHKREEARAEVRDLLAWKPLTIDLAILERAAGPLSTSVLGCANCCRSKNSGLRIPFDRGLAGRAGIGWAEGRESILNRPGIAWPVSDAGPTAASVLK